MKQRVVVDNRSGATEFEAFMKLERERIARVGRLAKIVID